MTVVTNTLQTQLNRAARRFGASSSKRGNRFYYKGRGSWKGGFNTKNGKFQAEPSKMRFLVVPDLTDFKLTPYVANDTPVIKVAPPLEHIDSGPRKFF